MRNIKNLFLFIATLLLVTTSVSTIYCQSKTITPNKVIDTIPLAEIQKEIFQKDTILIIEKEPKLKPYKKSVLASYYADKFNGRKTANGTIFSNNKLTAAHKKLPFGTKVKVTNELNGKSVIVEITDRGPFVKPREIDLSKRAFMNIVKRKGAGIMTVTLEIVEED